VPTDAEIEAELREHAERDARQRPAGGSVAEYEIAHLDEIDEITDGREPWRPIRHHFGITSFGINAWTGREAGDRIINEHDEADDGNEELYAVIRGRATFELDGERLDATAGTLVYVRPGVKRTAFAEEAGTTILAAGGVPGQAYEPDGWEIWAPLRPLYEAGEYAEVADRGRAVIEAHPEYPEPMYNLACCEALAGRTEDAIEHLRLALEKAEQLRSFAKEDSDLDPIRDDPAFKALVGD
jgi:tetratricopeptide (TPR) repeat protein